MRGLRRKTKCGCCGKPVVLVPSARERAAKYGGEPSDYSRLFTYHSDCFLAQRRQETSDLIASNKVRSSHEVS